MRRANIALNKRIEIGNVVADSEKYAVYSDTKYIELPKKEFELLFKLLSYPDRIFSKEQLLDSIWGVNAVSGEDTVKTHISRFESNEEIQGKTYKGDTKTDQRVFGSKSA